MGATVFTIGHSNRGAEQFIALLARHDVSHLVDIRAFPRSRRYPQFDRAALEGALASAGVAYSWHGKALGGFRKPRRDSRHLALADSAFRGFADHMDSTQFQDAVRDVEALAADGVPALMCAEADPGHCHRQFIADYLCRRGVTVQHIMGDGQAPAHQPHACLEPGEGALLYNKHVQGDLFD